MRGSKETACGGIETQGFLVKRNLCLGSLPRQERKKAETNKRQLLITQGYSITRRQ